MSGNKELRKTLESKVGTVSGKFRTLQNEGRLDMFRSRGVISVMKQDVKVG